jgi:hypothetical protein
MARVPLPVTPALIRLREELAQNEYLTKADVARYFGSADLKSFCSNRKRNDVDFPLPAYIGSAKGGNTLYKTADIVAYAKRHPLTTGRSVPTGREPIDNKLVTVVVKAKRAKCDEYHPNFNLSPVLRMQFSGDCSLERKCKTGVRESNYY